MSLPFDLNSAAVSDSHFQCHAHADLLKATAEHGRLSTAVLCCGLEKNGVVGAWHGRCESDTTALFKSNGKDTF